MHGNDRVLREVCTIITWRGEAAEINVDEVGRIEYIFI